jgi:uncharacterized protein
VSALASYLVDVRPILDEFGGHIPLNAEIEFGQIDVGDESFVPMGSARLDAHLTSAGAGVVLGGTLEMTVQAVCSRCLREFPLDVKIEVDGFYIEPGQEAELPEEQEFAYVTEGSVDIADALVTSLALELPFAPLHAEDCPGICPQCGADLVDGPCSCGPDSSASPFASLAELFPADADE